MAFDFGWVGEVGLEEKVLMGSDFGRKGRRMRRGLEKSSRLLLSFLKETGPTMVIQRLIKMVYI